MNPFLSIRPNRPIEGQPPPLEVTDTPSVALPAASPADGAAPAPPSAESPTDSWGFELLMYGNEQMIQGSDNGTLVAFAALAFQQIRGKGEPHHDIACGILLFAVLMCALVHFAIGNAYVSRAKRILRGGRELRRQSVARRFYATVAWVAAIVQFICVVAGVLLILPEKPPTWLKDLVLWRF